MAALTVYGIPNCDTIKKSLDWLRNNKLNYEFHDYKKSGITRMKLTAWCKQVGWETLLNKQSATWRSLAPEFQATITNQGAAIQLMMENTSIIKRPVIEQGENLTVGFTDTAISKLLKSKK